MELDLSTLWMLLGLFIILSPLFYNRGFEHLVNVSLGLLLSFVTYYYFHTSSYYNLIWYNLIFVLIGTYFLLKFGVSSSCFSAKKFVCYHSIALILLLVAYFGGEEYIASALILSLAIVLAAYLFHGWLEPFFMHAPSGLLSTYLIFFYPLNIIFTLRILSVILKHHDNDSVLNICLFLGICGSLLGAVLFFARTENRRFLAYLTTWYSSLMFLFMNYCPIERYFILENFSIIYGILLAFLGQCFVYLHHKFQHDKLITFNEVKALNKNCSVLIQFVLILLGLLPFIEGIISHISIIAWLMVISAQSLYIFFVKNLLNNRPQDNYFSFK